MIWHKYLWPEWKIVNEIGSGAYGTVYKIRRVDASGVYFAALKVIIVSLKNEMTGISVGLSGNKEQRETAERTEALDTGDITGNSSNVTGFEPNTKRPDYTRFAEEVSKEISFMEKFKGNSNIVSYEDHRIVFDEGSQSWIVLIRMELLSSLTEYFASGTRGEMDVVRLGTDICNALYMCGKEGVLHRDVKPGNIFVSEFGNFKLGDFGIAFITHNTRTMREPIGTHDYMAPEVVRERMYNWTVDLYSLGIIMYRILNGGRAPFITKDGGPVSNQVLKEADARRLNGEPLPGLPGVPKALERIVLKACSYMPQNRYQTAEEMRDELREYIRDMKTEERIRNKAAMNQYFSVAGELD